MHLQESVEQGIDVLALAGEIDLHYAPVLRSLLQAKVKAHCPALVLDLAEVTFIDSSGLAAIIEYFRDTSANEGVLCLAGLNENLQTIFEIVRLEKVLAIFPTRRDALAAVARGDVQPMAQKFFARSAA